MNENKWLILLGVWSNVVATVTLIHTLRGKPNKKSTKRSRKR